MSFQIGAHQLQVEGDLVFVSVQGDVNEAEVVEILRHAETVQASYGYHLGLLDIRHFGKISPQVRRYVGEWGSKRYSLVCNACFGGSMLSRGLITLVTRAISLLRGQESEVAFFKTEAEARTWLDAQRPRFQNAKTRGNSR